MAEIVLDPDFELPVVGITVGFVGAGGLGR